MASSYEYAALSVCNHLPPITNSKLVNPVALPPGRAKLATNPWPTGSANIDEYDRYRAGGLLGRRQARRARREDDIRKRLRASGRDGETVMTEPPSPLRMLLSRHTSAPGKAGAIQPVEVRPK